MEAGHLAILARHAREVEFATDQVIFRQNENAHQFFLIMEGEVVVESYIARADNLPLQIITAGEVLGWSWLFPPFVWHFQAKAIEPTKAIFIDGASLLVACEQVHSFGFYLMQRIAQIVIKRLEEAQRKLLELEKSVGALPRPDRPGREGVVGCAEATTLKGMLAEHPFSKGMKADHLEILAEAAMKSRFEAGQIIFHEGDPANRFYLIQHGNVALESPGTESMPDPFQIIGAGKFPIPELFACDFDTRLEALPLRQVPLGAERRRKQDRSRLRRRRRYGGKLLRHRPLSIRRRDFQREDAAAGRRLRHLRCQV